MVVASVFWSPSSLEQSLVSSKKKEKLFLQVYGMCCCVSDRSVYETYRDGLCYSVVKMEILSPIELDFLSPIALFHPGIYKTLNTCVF